MEKAAIFLVNKSAKTSLINEDCETILHLACENGMRNLVEILLEKSADPNVQSSKQTSSQTPMHKAILNSHEDILNIFIKHNAEQKGKVGSKFLANFNIKDSDGQSVLSLCLWSGLIALAKKLIGSLNFCLAYF